MGGGGSIKQSHETFFQVALGHQVSMISIDLAPNVERSGLFSTCIVMVFSLLCDISS